MPLPLNQAPIALLAGRGNLPQMLIHAFQSQHRPFVVLAFKGHTDESLTKDIPHLWVHFGEVGKALNYFKKNNIQNVVMAGAIARPGLSEIRPDWEGVKWLAKIGSRALGDDNILKLIIGMLTEYGYQVVGPDEILTDLLAEEGILSSQQPDEQAWRDIGRGVEVLSALSPVDVGQAVVVQEGLILGVEALEGTDALIERAGALQRPGLGGVLVKIAKRQQEQRADLPTIGSETIHRVAKAGLRGVAIEAGRSLILDRKEVSTLAKKKGLFIVGLNSAQCHTNL